MMFIKTLQNIHAINFTINALGMHFFKIMRELIRDLHIISLQ